MPLTFGSLFSGIGGLDLGLERAGMVCSWQVETNEYCNKVLAKWWPGVPRFRDIRDCGSHNLQAVDLVCGGFPCQPFSVAGKQRGRADDRYLWPEMLRVIREAKPHWVLGENVAGIINLALDTVLADLEAEGYSTQAFIIPACGVDAPHRRDRVWIVAHSPRGQFEQLQSRLEEEIRLGAASRWLPEPRVGRVAHGVPSRVDRLKALGNAVVPQCAELIGRLILETLCTSRS